MISVIIPTYNEIETTLKRLVSSLDHKEVGEVIVVNSGALSYDLKDYPNVKMIRIAKKSRAVQMNEGAARAAGDVLLFMHADSVLSETCIDSGLKALADEKTSMIAFDLRFDSSRKSMRRIESGVRLRNRLFCLPYGDQCYMMTRAAFDETGGYDQVPMLEDVRLLEKLKKLGRVRILPAHVTTSARRYEERGVLRTYLSHVKIILLYHLGVSPERLSYLRE